MLWRTENDFNQKIEEFKIELRKEKNWKSWLSNSKLSVHDMVMARGYSFFSNDYGFSNDEIVCILKNKYSETILNTNDNKGEFPFEKQTSVIYKTILEESKNSIIMNAYLKAICKFKKDNKKRTVEALINFYIKNTDAEKVRYLFEEIDNSYIKNLSIDGFETIKIMYYFNSFLVEDDKLLNKMLSMKEIFSNNLIEGVICYSKNINIIKDLVVKIEEENTLLKIADKLRAIYVRSKNITEENKLQLVENRFFEIKSKKEKDILSNNLELENKVNRMNKKRI